MAIIYWWWMLKVAAQNDLDLLNCRSLGTSSQIWAQSRRFEADRAPPPPVSASSGLKGSGNDPSLFTACERKAICKSLSTNVRCGRGITRARFSHLSKLPHLSAPLGAPTVQTPGKWQFSLICRGGPPEPPSGPWNEFISPQWDANDWCYNNITPCHNQLCILKREETRRSVTFSSALSPAWKDDDSQHEFMKRFGSVNTYCTQFFLADFTRNFILLL